MEARPMKKLRMSLLITLCFALAQPLLADGSKPTLGISIPFGLLAGMDGSITLDCNSSNDSDTRAMIRSLQKKGRRGHYEFEEDGDRLVADRRGKQFRMTAWEDKERKLDLEMPWSVAECIFGGRAGDEIEIEISQLDDLGGFELRLAGDNAGIRVSVD
jgi:hypothetical protein